MTPPADVDEIVSFWQEHTVSFRCNGPADWRAYTKLRDVATLEGGSGGWSIYTAFAHLEDYVLGEFRRGRIVRCVDETDDSVGWCWRP